MPRGHALLLAARQFGGQALAHRARQSPCGRSRSGRRPPCSRSCGYLLQLEGGVAARQPASADEQPEGADHGDHHHDRVFLQAAPAHAPG